MLLNLTRHIIIRDRVILANKPLRRLLGWMFKDIRADEALILSPCYGVHTCFMRGSIDVIALDRECIVRAIYEKMPPWRMTSINRHWYYVIEIQGGTLNDTVKQGDKIIDSERTML